MGNSLSPEIVAYKRDTPFFDIVEEDIDGRQVLLGDICGGKVTFCINVAAN